MHRYPLYEDLTKQELFILLNKYIDHVREAEGVTFIPKEFGESLFTCRELEVLLEAERGDFTEARRCK